MTAKIMLPMQACIVVLGCTLIHAAREHAALLARCLTGIAAVITTSTVVAATALLASDPQGRFAEIAVYAALAGQPIEPE